MIFVSAATMIMAFLASAARPNSADLFSYLENPHAMLISVACEDRQLRARALCRSSSAGDCAGVPGRTGARPNYQAADVRRPAGNRTESAGW